MWISKEGDIRKQELLDAALQLFQEKGYEKTSINDILQKVGVTKGAFYYYFKSKEEILNVLSEQQAGILIKIARKIAADGRLDALEKLNGIAAEALGFKAANMGQRTMAYKALQHESGIILGMKILETTVKKASPIIQSIIEQGLQEGIFDTAFSRDTAELYILLSSIISSTVTQVLLISGKKPESFEIIRKKLVFYEDVFKRLLGIKKGGINLVDAAMKYI